MTSLVFLLSLLWLSLAASVQANSPTMCFRGSKLCFSATLESTNTTAIMTVNTTVFPFGWVAIGIGSGMSDANIWLMYYNSITLPFRLTDRISSSYALPSLASNNTLTLLGPPTVDGATYSVKFSRPLSAHGFEITNSYQPFLWAFAENSTTTDTNIVIHTSKGLFTYNVFAGDGASPIVSLETAIKWHKFLMAFAWNGVSGIAIFTARFLKPRLPKSWFRVHAGLFSLVLGMTAVGFLVMVVAHPAPHFASAHGILGLVVVCAAFCQFFLGVYIDRTFDPHRTRIPSRDRGHWALGYAVYLLAAANVFLGIVTLGAGVGWIVCSALVYAGFILAFIVAQYKCGQTHDAAGFAASA